MDFPTRRCIAACGGGWTICRADCNLENRDGLRADDDGVLAKSLFERFAIASPPFRVDFAGHHFEHHDLVVRGLSVALPQSLRGRAREGGEPTEAFGELAPNPGVKHLAERLAVVVEQRKQDLHEVHAAGRLSLGALAAFWRLWPSCLS